MMHKLAKLNSLPIRFKLVIHFLLISILPSLLLAVLVGWAVDRIIEQQVNENTLQLIDKVNSTIEAHIENVQNMTYFISLHSNIQQFLDGTLEHLGPDEEYEISKFLQNFTTLYPEIAGILVVNQQGDYLSNELYTRSSFNLNQESWYRQAVENKGIAKLIGKPQGRRITSHVHYREDEVVTVVRAIIDSTTGEEKGVILIDLKLRVIEEAVRDVRLGKSGYLMVVDQKGDPIYSPAPSIMYEQSFDHRFSQNYGIFTEEVEGERYQLMYQQSAFTGWTLIGVFSTDQSVEEVQQILFYVVTFVFFVCFVGITASYFLSYTISRPINQLMLAMQKAESGDLTSRYEGEEQDEVGRLGRSFNTMIEQIGKLISLTERQERKKREAELHSLQANIKPHFLYNTLDTIQWMARKKNASDVADLVGALSKLFRIGLSKGGTIIPLVDEIEHIKNYLQIQSVRYKNKLNYSLVIPSNMEHLSILKIVLQPIVENAIYHGIKERRGPGLITIEAERENDMLIIRIRDNGKGIKPETLQQLRTNVILFLERGDKEGGQRLTKGYGLINVHARLRLTFGEPYGVKIDSVFNEGTVVTIFHPILEGGVETKRA
ncbi:sensor histidine kinase [Halalkalibacterium halodurans]|uniref:sensor histidine kinase n=1 Tax=Halalkalibacterium halodurans TaxID=86665 RepID=UPI002AAA599A|nr:sensor histidine kinase [Halalkalibacterium halodurans]MDY7223973.1 sensor histidine kinase [Halalkalibacterium halodurans]MDY7243194.1 sensor histidine kinase [Halalkalibacterium halodurans]